MIHTSSFGAGKLTLVEAAAGAGTSALVSDAVDMAGYKGCVFFGTIATANAGNYFSVAQCDTSDGSYDDLAGTKVTPASNGDVGWVEIVNPLERYLKCTITRGASTATGDLYCYQYGAAVQPVNNLETNVMIGETHVSPAEGTA